jgi:hypothetical protein
MNIKCQENIISILKIKVQRSLIFLSSQSEYIKFSRDESESTTQIWVALLWVHKQYYQFS